jgi:hypothetical protein
MEEAYNTGEPPFYRFLSADVSFERTPPMDVERFRLAPPPVPRKGRRRSLIPFRGTRPDGDERP